MEYFNGSVVNIAAFLVFLTILVFIHELGHYLVARWNGVRVDVFSVGFGREVFGRTDRAGTRWKFCAVPLGGYVKMFGDVDAASTQAADDSTMSAEDRAVSFHHKRLGQRAAIVAAGPIANFLFAILVFFVVLVSSGYPGSRLLPAVVGDTVIGGAAEEAGIEPGSKIVAIDGQPVSRFAEVVALIVNGDGAPVVVTTRKDGVEAVYDLTPRMTEVEGRDGTVQMVPMLGIQAQVGPYPVGTAAILAVTEVGYLVKEVFSMIGEMIAGDRGTEELGGPLMIGKVAGDVAKTGEVALMLFWLGFLSINLGLINLFPIPILDGGHLLFYAIEAVRGRPLGERAQEYGFRIGLALVLTLMVFATWNDVVQLWLSPS